MGKLCVDVNKFLLDKLADVKSEVSNAGAEDGKNGSMNKGGRPLHQASGWSLGHFDAVKLLIDNGADVNAKTSGGESLSIVQAN